MVSVFACNNELALLVPISMSPLLSIPMPRFHTEIPLRVPPVPHHPACTAFPPPTPCSSHHPEVQSVITLKAPQKCSLLTWFCGWRAPLKLPPPSPSPRPERECVLAVGSGVVRAAGHGRHLLTGQRRHLHRLQLLLCAAQSQLAVLPPAPRAQALVRCKGGGQERKSKPFVMLRLLLRAQEVSSHLRTAQPQQPIGCMCYQNM